MISRMKQGDHSARDQCIAFTTFESRGMWHNRARASICRFLKTHPPSPEDPEQLVAVVCTRLTTGYFTEQFNEQLSMAIRFSPDKMDAVADESGNDDRDYVRRYCRGVRVAVAARRNDGGG